MIRIVLPRPCFLRAILLLSCLLAGRAVAAQQSDSVFRVDDRVAILGNTFADQMRKHGYFETLIQHRLVGYRLAFRNFGWAGDTVTDRARPENFAAEDQWLADHKTDVIIACFGMGESFAGQAGLDEFRREQQKLVEHYQQTRYDGKSAPRIILVTPIAYEDLGELTPRQQTRNRQLVLYAKAMREVADETGALFVDLYTPTQKLMRESGGSKLTSNGIHLTPYGYWAVSQILANELAPESTPTELVIDAATPSSRGSGAAVAQLTATDERLRWEVQSWDWPVAPPPPGSRVHPSLLAQTARLTVENLPPGEYRLVIAGEPIRSATHDQWSRGVSLNFLPSQQSVERYRQQVVDKNAQFFYSWRALNQVHIVGQRKKSPSGRALPAELIEFSRLAEQHDASLRSLNPAPTQLWKLTRTDR